MILMDEEIKISKALERKARQEEELEIKKALTEDNNNINTEISSSSSEGKIILITVLIIIGILAFAIGGVELYEHYFTSATVIDVDNLHQQNLGGDLDETEGYMYNGFSFIKADGMWWTEMNKFGKLLKVPLHFGPKEVENITMIGDLKEEFNEGDIVYIAIDPKVQDKYYTLAVSELSFNVVKGMDRIPTGSCTEEGYGCDNRTIISCNNSQNKPVIELALSEKNEIEFSGTCIKISGNNYELVKAVDKLLLYWYGIIKE